MNTPKLYKMPIAVAAVLLVIGILSVTNLIYLPWFISDFNGMDYGFALVFLGVFLIIVSGVIFYYFGRFNRNFQNMLEGKTLLSYVLPKELYRFFRDQESENIKASNKAVLFVIYGFSVIFGIIFSLTIDVLFLAIMLGIDVFFTLVYFSVTAYRTRKVKRSEALVCMNEGCVYLFGQMHSWSLPGSHPVFIELENKQAEGLPCPCIILKYTALAYPAPRSETVAIPVPVGYETQAARTVETIKNLYNL